MMARKQIPLVKLNVDGVRVDAKACTKCNEVKALSQFGPSKAGRGGVHSVCRECVAEYLRRKYREKVLEGGRDVKRVRRKTKWNTETYAQAVSQFTNGEYILIDQYKGVGTKLKHFHYKCGNACWIYPHRFLNGGRCDVCYVPPMKKFHADYVKEVKEYGGGDYSVLGVYVNSETKILHRHNVCGREYPVTPHGFLRGTRCPYCIQSRGEAKVSEVLTRLRVVFDTQHKIKECRYKSPLPFDHVVFYGREAILIEYDGEQHSRPVDYAGKGVEHAKRRFRETQRNDRIKTDYCRANGIPLIRIDYTEFDEIESILTRELTNLGVISSETGNRLNDAI
jgi:hypothetical protein